MQKYDYIITGMGATGLMLAYQMTLDSFFDQKKILLIDKETKDQNDRTWCFWEKGNGDWDAILHKEWRTIYFGSERYSRKIAIAPYAYKMIRGKDFYGYVIDRLSQKKNITFRQEALLQFRDNNNGVVVETDQNQYIAEKLFNSVLMSNTYTAQKKYPVLNQHFLGWFIKTEKDVFDDEVATFMDFTVSQKGNTRFMYVLPSSKKEALFEYTLFSEELLSDKEYEDEIRAYLAKKGIANYKITEKEKGCIPMTCYEFHKSNTKNIKENTVLVL